MEFTKSAITHSEQIALLVERGLIIEDASFAKKILSKISYYRLRAYWLTFEVVPNDESKHRFKPNVFFNQIVNTYDFDRELRHIVFKALDRIEIALRTQLIYHANIYTNDNIWYAASENFKSADNFDSFLKIFNIEYKNSHEVFIKHYKSKYTSPEFPPSWMALEILSFGQLSLLFKNINLTDVKKEIAQYFGVPYK